tara:strand:+ start:5286 stop:5582 length:297 start_codon:yes stop_codon:yes gene_type:complete
MSQDSPDPVTEAAERLTRALSRVEMAVGRLRDRANAAGDSDSDRARLAEALDDARAREESITAAANEASEALAVAISELRQAAQSAEDAVEAEDTGNG